MPVIIALLRAINVGGRNKIEMHALRTVCESLGCSDVQSYIQSGNVLFTVAPRSATKIQLRLEESIEAKFGFRPAVITRTLTEWREVIANNPFAAKDFEPNRLLVTFLSKAPAEKARQQLASIRTEPEEVHVKGREFYMYFPNGMARPKTTPAAIEKALQVPGTGRNWNTVMKLLALAERMETAQT